VARSIRDAGLAAELAAAYESHVGRTAPRTRKTRGVYYTPAYIVERIVEDALGGGVSGAAIDPACGGGSFLVRALEKGVAPGRLYGIDIDPQAVEVARLSLALAAGCEAAALAHNIRCADALLDDWEELFPEVFREGGFDAAIGNPPYLSSAGRSCEERFALGEYQTDSYVLFLEQAFRKLKPGGRLGAIVSDSWLKGKRFSKLRNFLLHEARLTSVVIFDYPPFAGAAIESSILTVEKRPPAPGFDVFIYRTPERVEPLNHLAVEDCAKRIDARLSRAAAEALAAMERDSRPLGECCLVNRGVHAYRTGGYGRSRFSEGRQTARDKAERSYHAREALDATYLPEVKGKHLTRYGRASNGEYISYGEWLAEPRRPEFFFSPKLAIRKIIAPRLVCTYIEEPVVLDQSVYAAIARDGADLLFVLGVLASAAGGWYLRTRHGIYDRLYPWFTKEQLASFPLPRRTDPRIAQLAARMLRAPGAGTDAQIDALVFDLYGLAPDEARLIESGAQ
jgi:SAM-dependent methyltransferase